MKNRLSSFNIFMDLKDEEYNLLNQHARMYNVPSQTTFIHEKQYCDYIYFILSGVVSVYKINNEGKRKVIFVHGSGNFINEEQQNDLNSVISAQALEDTMLLCIPKDIFDQLLEMNFEFMKKIHTSMARKIRRMYRQLNNMEVRLDKKVASKFYKLAKDHGIPCEMGTLIYLNLSITYLSDLLGAQRESVSRAVKVLMDEGLIYRNKKSFVVKDMELLANYFKKAK